MNKVKQRQLSKKGWKLGTAADFLELSAEEAAYVEMKVMLSRKLKEQRIRKHLNQTQLARYRPDPRFGARGSAARLRAWVANAAGLISLLPAAIAEKNRSPVWLLWRMAESEFRRATTRAACSCSPLGICNICQIRHICKAPLISNRIARHSNDLPQ